MGILENKFLEHSYDFVPQLQCVSAGDTIKLGAFAVEFIRVNHSIADACCLAIKTPVGTVIHTGDFKIDVTPIEGEMINLTRLGEYGNEGVLLLMCESTNAEHPGHTPSEKNVGVTLDSIFLSNSDKRIIIATFSSNVHRVQQVINTSIKYGRKVAITGRSMLNVVNAAIRLGYMDIPDGVIIDINEAKRFSKDKVTIVTTGSQGEPMSGLYRMAYSEFDKVQLGPDDLIVLSASAVPGNEKMVDNVINEVFKCGASVIKNSLQEVHVSGHACQEELKMMMALTKPKFFMPIHGEYRHLVQNQKLAVSVGIPQENTIITEVGKVVEFDDSSYKFNGTIPSGLVMVDGYGVGDVGNIVLRDRRHLAQDGLIVIVASVDIQSQLVFSGPDIVSRGFVYVRESEELMEELRGIAKKAIEDCFASGATDWMELKNKIKTDISKYIYNKTKRKPMILPIVMDM